MWRTFGRLGLHMWNGALLDRCGKIANILAGAGWLAAFAAGCTQGGTATPPATVKCRTREPGKVAYVYEWKFELVRRAILDEAAAKRDGVLMRELPDAVRSHIPVDQKQDFTSLKWLVDVVTSELQARHEIAIERRSDKFFVTIPSPAKRDK